MYTTELDTKDAGYFKFAAQRNARMKSYAASTGYTLAERTRAERIKLGLELVYSGKMFYVTFRKKFIVIKIEGANVRDKATLKALETDYTAQGITKVVTAQGISYRIMKVQ
jgi:hypothetical protein